MKNSRILILMFLGGFAGLNGQSQVDYEKCEKVRAQFIKALSNFKDPSNKILMKFSACMKQNSYHARDVEVKDLPLFNRLLHYPVLYPSLLHYAAVHGVKAIDTLLDNGYDIEIKDGKFNSTALFIAVLHNNLQGAQRLIIRGANIEAKNDVNGATPIRFANSVEMLQLLHDNKADCNAQDEYGWTFLHNDFHRPALVQKLINLGANIDVRGGAFDKTPLEVRLQFIVDYDNEDWAQRVLLACRESIMLLVAHGADQSNLTVTQKKILADIIAEDLKLVSIEKVYQQSVDLN